MLHIIDEVLLISRFDAGNHLLEIERTNIAALLSEISMSHKTACAAKKINLTLDLPDENLELMIDKAKVRQVMTGLVENAIKYTQTGSICIGASYADKSLRLFVRDTGLGVPENEQEHIFKRFYRGQKGQKMAVRGNGLGLSIAQRIVEVMHGTIGLISQEEKGSEFFITLQANELDAQLNQQEAENWLLADFGRYRLLVVDDEIDNALFLSSALEKYFAEIAIANTALQSLDLQRAKPFDIVLMDIKMPGMNGDEATKLLLKEFPDTIVIGQTAYSQPEELKRMILAGAKTCLTKPLSLKKILDEIYNQLILSGKL